MENNKRKEILYQKTAFNNHLICQFSNIFKCCKCKKNNTVFIINNNLSQNCIFCGTPNYIKKREKSIS
jgi:hypothetical protein